MRLLAFAVVVVLFAQDVSSRRIAFDRPVDGGYRVRGVVTYRNTVEHNCCSTQLTVSLVDRQNPSRYWTLAELSDEYEITFDVERADERSMVIARTDAGHGMDEGKVKLFFDTRSKRLLKQIVYATPSSAVFESDAQAQRMLGLSADGAAKFMRRGRSTTASPDSPGGSLSIPWPASLPSTTWEEFARARPQRVADGYDEKYTRFEDNIGPTVLTSEGLWFGKTFYDGEGTTGLGGIGLIDDSGLQMLRIPELFDWSVSDMLVEPATIWVGLVRHGEAPDDGGGLVEYSRRTRRARIHRVSGIINAITRVDDAIFVDASYGLYVVRGNARQRFWMEPAIDGTMKVLSETVQ